MECLRSYFQFVVNTVDSMPLLSERSGKKWNGILTLEPTPGAMKRHERLTKVCHHLLNATDRTQRAYGDSYTREGLDALTLINVFLNSEREELHVPVVALREHSWEYWNGSFHDSKFMRTLYFTKTPDDMQVFVDKDAPSYRASIE